MWKKIVGRFRNKAFTVFVLGALATLLVDLGFDIDMGIWDKYVKILLTFLAMVGFWNNPVTENTGLKDDNTYNHYLDDK